MVLIAKSGRIGRTVRNQITKGGFHDKLILYWIRPVASPLEAIIRWPGIILIIIGYFKLFTEIYQAAIISN